MKSTHDLDIFKKSCGIPNQFSCSTNISVNLPMLMYITIHLISYKITVRPKIISNKLTLLFDMVLESPSVLAVWFSNCCFYLTGCGQA
jgi:hypothetical protein